MSALSKYLKKYGIEQEKDYPYAKYPDEATAKTGACKYNKTKAFAIVNKVYQTRQGDENALKQALATRGVVAIGVDATTCIKQLRIFKLIKD